jgi:CRISPR-associated protein Csm4
MSQQLHIVYLRPTAGFRTELRSDTLWGIVCWGIRLLYGEAELEAFIEKNVKGQPDFVLSSAFPFKQYGKDKYHFFPKPIREKLEWDDAINIGAKYKKTGREFQNLFKKFKTEWVELDDFNKILKKNLSEADLFDRYLDEKTNLTDETKYQSVSPRFEEVSYTHNTIDRIHGSTLKKMRDDGSAESGQLFHAEETFLIDEFREKENEDSRNTGLFFLVRGNVEKLKAVLHFYRVNGWGGDRFTGKGTFEAEIELAPAHFLTAPQDANASVCLSLLHPKKTELAFLENAESRLFQYKLLRRQGKSSFFQEHRIKNVLLHFEEGSVFPKNGLETWGQVLETQQFKVDKNGIINYEKPDDSLGHKIFHNGLGFMVHLKI